MPPKQSKLNFKKKVASESEEEDFEVSDGSDVEMPPLKPKKQASKKSRAAESDDDDDDVEMAAAPARGGSSKQKSASETYQKVR